MRNDFDAWKEHHDENLLFSRIVKAGKRVYYIDVKRDRNDEYYISMTESKRLKEGTDGQKPQYEKHKLFLYREDILKFLNALTDAAQYVGEQRSLTPRNNSFDDFPIDSESPQSPTLHTSFDVEF